jgi:phage anti-repressor protein
VYFEFDGNSITGLEQNPETKSNWAKLAREGMKVMQFTQNGRYIAVVAAEKVTLYGKRVQ